ncbi:DNA polymerase III subunit delta [Nitrosomonas oligotropha]|uniref:DNA polymerase III subunit delta n=1 Tax=Nitrosomonas oligotropha TaxID=42354 RepID=UPI00136FD87D|nr:DNA polymerase III subunit delta [Nitrosomonas oligotropha]MXS81505.1 DNA polymerase III subunit delta [Nitrosomonas oligotropha]
MRIKLEQIQQQLQKQTVPLYTLFGSEPLLILEAADQIRTHARQQGYTERELFTADQHFDWAELLNAGNNLSLFGDRKIMDLRIPSGKPGREGGKALETYCAALPPDTVTLIILPRIDKQGQASKWFKALETAGTLIAVYPVERDQLPGWIGQRLAKQQQKADAATLQFLASQVEGNLLAAHQEIQKLALLYPAGNLTFEQVKDVVLNVARYDVFQLSDAMITGDIARFMRVLTGLQGEGAAPLLILATLTEQIRQLVAIRKGLDNGQPPAQLLQTARIWGDRQKPVMTAAQRISIQALLQALTAAAEIDRMIKGVAQGDVWEGLLQLGLRFTRHKLSN